MQFTAAFFVLAIAQCISAISLHPRQEGGCVAEACDGPVHCCPAVPDLIQPPCQSIYTSCEGATCSPGTEWTITCAGDDHCCPTANGAHCQPSGELCGILN
ncbi:small secreted protein with six-cysteine repeat motif-containing protein [Pleurotus ostreatus PC15]|uniref:Small secreted protein with six-cysteine repeat motif-containing protein n=1 Tax=Pleurotus ostreatus (strain PC15) TaxID=1137138 RepID=A0A067NVF1_PLEO1|nr:small secreted protein with six-cysteine repeat motif-containing protein [Pleurotus ostreatus PC15]